MAPYLGLSPSAMWPPTAKSAPFLSSIWLVLISIVYVVLSADGDNATHAAATAKRRDTKMRTLKNIVVMEECRLALMAKKANTKMKEKKSVERMI